MQSLLRNRSSLHICAASCPTAQKHANPIPAPILRQSTPARIDLGALAWREGRIPWRNRLRERLPGKALHGYLFYALTGYATGPLASRRTPLGSVHHHRHYGQKGQTDRTESGSSTVRDYFRSLPFGLGRLNRKGHRAANCCDLRRFRPNTKGVTAQKYCMVQKTGLKNRLALNSDG